MSQFKEPLYDSQLLTRARTQWQFGDWQSLAQLAEDQHHLAHHPERAELRILATAGTLQIQPQPDAAAAKAQLKQSLEEGASREAVARMLIAGAHNSIGRAAVISNQLDHARTHFEKAIVIGAPNNDNRLLACARFGEQLSQIGLATRAGSEKIGFGSKASKIEFQLLPPEIREKLLDNKYANFSSGQYWEDRYKKGLTSGYGSYGRLAEFKSKVINKFIEDESIERVIEFGCGDGNQLSMLRVKNYIGVDISPTIINKCKNRFQEDVTKLFFTNEKYLENPLKGMLTLSIDVIFHLIEDDVFENYMTMLFDAAERYCIIYACDENWLESDDTHVRRRKFNKWIAENLKEWRLMQVTYNKYPHDGSRNPKDLSFSNFYFYERL